MGLALVTVFLALLACRAVLGPPLWEPTALAIPATASQPAGTTEAPLPTPTHLKALSTATQAPSATHTTPSISETSHNFTVRFHPDGELYAGDQVSFEVIAPAGKDLAQAQVRVALEEGDALGQAEFSGFGIAQRLQATLLWVWDTQDLPPGMYTLVFTIEPGGQQWVETVTLQSPDALPPGSAQVAWAQARNDCCVVFYMTGTAAERDLTELLDEIDRQAQETEQQLELELSEPVTITLLPRLLGHGGFASNEIHVSYLDRNYAGGLPEMVLQHELVHVLDSSLGGEHQPSLLVEGLAVYLSGGHFKPEPLIPRAAALLDVWGTEKHPGLDWYLPLAPLTDNFYRSQHEIGYLQAGALVEFLIQTCGWEAFQDFYADFREFPSQSQALDDALRRNYSLGLEELEAQFVEILRSQPYDPGLLADVRLTVQYYDTVRRYQQALDPSAYFMTAWLLDTQKMREQGIVADYLRHPQTTINLILELVLANAGEAIAQGRLQYAEQHILAANAVLDALQDGWQDPLNASILAANVASAAEALQQNPVWIGASPGSQLEIQRLWVDGEQARAWVSSNGALLQEIYLVRSTQGTWQFQQAGSE